MGTGDSGDGEERTGGTSPSTEMQVYRELASKELVWTMHGDVGPV